MEKVASKIPKRVFITGATSGLGREAALELARNGHQIWFLARSEDKAIALLNDFKNLHPDAEGSLMPVYGDLADFNSVIKACDALKTQTERLDLLIHNAGIWNFRFLESADEIEETWQVNTLSLYVITQLLVDNLLKGRDPRIILTASGLHQGEIRFSDPELRTGEFSGFKAYRQSKLAIILLSRYWAEVFAERGIFVCCQHPGLVNTALVRRGGWFARIFFKLFGRSPGKGAETLIALSEKPPGNLKPGAFYKDHTATKTTPYSYRMDVAEKLVEQIEKVLREKGVLSRNNKS